MKDKVLSLRARRFRLFFSGASGQQLWLWSCPQSRAKTKSRGTAVCGRRRESLLALGHVARSDSAVCMGASKHLMGGLARREVWWARLNLKRIFGQPDRAKENSPPIHRWVRTSGRGKSRQGRKNSVVPARS